MPEKLSDVAGAAKALQHRPGTKRYTTKDHDEKTTQVSFRGFPRRLNERLKEIADREGKTVAQVAVPTIAYALAQIDNDSATLAEMEHLVQDAELG